MLDNVNTLTHSVVCMMEANRHRIFCKSWIEVFSPGPVIVRPTHDFKSTII